MHEVLPLSPWTAAPSGRGMHGVVRTRSESSRSRVSDIREPGDGEQAGWTSGVQSDHRAGGVPSRNCRPRAGFLEDEHGRAPERDRRS